MNAGEFAIVDNGGFVETDLKNITRAKKALKDLRKDQTFGSSGRLTIVKVVGTFDNYMSGNQEYLGADGMPIED